jgi:tetratricopeptide (TPR) repeat protein
VVLRNDAISFASRGFAYANLGEYQKAIEDYDQAITLNPNNAISFGNRGLAYTNLGEYQKAINNYDQAIALDPDDFKIFNRLFFFS